MTDNEYYYKTRQLAKDLKNNLIYMTYLDDQGNPKMEIAYNATAELLLSLGYQKIEVGDEEDE